MKSKVYYIPKYKTIVLKNKLKVFWHDRSTINTIGIKVFVKIGGATEMIEGSAHFIEHLVSRTIEDALENLKIDGAVIATTSRVYTKYSVTIAPRDLKKTLVILQKALFSFEINKKEFDAEKNRILNEIAEYDDDPRFIIEDTLSKIITEESNSAFRDVAGSAEKVSDIKPETLKKDYENSYKLENIILGISAPFKISDSIKEEINNIFHTDKILSTSAILEVRKTTFLKRQISHISKENLGQIYFRIGFPVVEEFTFEKWIVMDIVNSFISQLLKPVLDKGFAYNISNNFIPAKQYAYAYIDVVFGDLKDMREGLKIIKSAIEIRDGSHQSQQVLY